MQPFCENSSRLLVCDKTELKLWFSGELYIHLEKRAAKEKSVKMANLLNSLVLHLYSELIRTSKFHFRLIVLSYFVIWRLECS